MVPLRAIAAALLSVGLAWVVLQLRSNWPTVQLVYRMVRGGPPQSREPMRLLVEAMPADVLPRVVVLAIPPKMGTTWAGHITHQLLVRGAAVDSSRNLQEDSTYPEFAAMLFGGVHAHEETDPPYWGREPFASYPTGPITIRTHLTNAELAALGLAQLRLVTVLRDPADTLVSFYRFIPTVAGLDYRTVPIEHVVNFLWAVGMVENMIQNLVDFWQRRHDPKVLVLFFDDLKKDLAGSVRRLANFLELSPRLSEEELALVTSQSTKEFMSSPAVVARFNDMPPQFQAVMMANMGLTQADMFASDTPVVRSGGGKSGEGRVVLPESFQRTLDEIWARVVLPVTNCSSFQEFRLQFWTGCGGAS